VQAAPPSCAIMTIVTTTITTAMAANNHTVSLAVGPGRRPRAARASTRGSLTVVICSPVPCLPLKRRLNVGSAGRDRCSLRHVSITAGHGLLPVFQDGHSCGEGVVDGLAAADGQLRCVLAVGQQRRSLLGGAAFCLGYRWPGGEPEAVADRGGGSDEAGGEVRVAALPGQFAERGPCSG
jgi:hypothetical protein